MKNGKYWFRVTKSGIYYMVPFVIILAGNCNSEKISNNTLLRKRCFFAVTVNNNDNEIMTKIIKAHLIKTLFREEIILYF